MVVDTSALVAILFNEPDADRFGKGRHAAGLNIGDCFSYALAMATGHPLLFKGNDFLHTDVRPTLPAEMN